MANLIFTLLVLAGVVVSLLIIGSLVIWMRGINVIALPGLGIMIATPLVTLLLIVLQFILIILAIFAGRYRTIMPAIMAM